jgi:hypothetical protein
LNAHYLVIVGALATFHGLAIVCRPLAMPVWVSAVFSRSGARVVYVTGAVAVEYISFTLRGHDI